MKAKEFFKKFASKVIWLNLLGMLVFIVLLFFGLKWWLNYYTHQGEQIEVPDLYGMDYRQALTIVEERGLQLTVNDSTYVKEKPAGCIVVQSPAKGLNVKQGRMIYVTINSLTIPRVRIPDVIDNCGYREAQARLQALEFKVLPPRLIDGEKDWVYGIQMDGHPVHAGDMVARESQLTLVIGNGANSDDAFGMDDDDYDYPSSESTPVDNGDVDDFVPVTDSDIIRE
jgi:beta-lactam-binding protein with PASTA domain